MKVKRHHENSLLVFKKDDKLMEIELFNVRTFICFKNRIKNKSDSTYFFFLMAI